MEHPKYNNPAGRILFVFQRAAGSQGSVPSSRAAQVFGTADEIQVLVTATLGLKAELEALKELIHASDLTDASRELYTQQMASIEHSVQSFAFAPANRNTMVWSWSVQATATVALQFMAAQLPMEPVATEEDLTRIRDLSEELREEIGSSETIPREFKRLLLELVRLIRDSVDQYAIRGNAGVREALARALGELFLSKKERAQTESQANSVWEKFKSLLGFTNSVATATRNTDYLLGESSSAVDAVQQMLGNA